MPDKEEQLREIARHHCSESLKLAKRVKELEAALKEISEWDSGDGVNAFASALRVARTALEAVER